MLNTTQLECFLAVANHLNFSRAAQELQKEAVWWEAWKKQVMEETKEEEARLWAQARERKDEVAAVMLKILLEGREE